MQNQNINKKDAQHKSKINSMMLPKDIFKEPKHFSRGLGRLGKLVAGGGGGGDEVNCGN